MVNATFSTIVLLGGGQSLLVKEARENHRPFVGKLIIIVNKDWIRSHLLRAGFEVATSVLTGYWYSDLNTQITWPSRSSKQARKNRILCLPNTKQKRNLPNLKTVVTSSFLGYVEFCKATSPLFRSLVNCTR